MSKARLARTCRSAWHLVSDKSGCTLCSSGWWFDKIRREKWEDCPITELTLTEDNFSSFIEEGYGSITVAGHGVCGSCEPMLKKLFQLESTEMPKLDMSRPVVACSDGQLRQPEKKTIQAR